ncbi:MAG: VacJ family lipoprotein [Gammaproteobacteria bacterium]|nr:VacJ family lipoprotein [Gammaproteobacteria bacterium]
MLALSSSGCATFNEDRDASDPFEAYNRTIYRFNETLDKTVLKPVAKGYGKVIPSPVKKGIRNIFSHLGDVLVLANDLLQLKIGQASSDFSRLFVNSTVGLFGLIDVASSWDIPKHNEDFGQTLGHWGFGSGPYLVLPILGPTTFRDGIGLVPEYKIDPVLDIKDSTPRYGAVVLRGVDTRAKLLKASRVLEDAALDPYVFLRDAYLQRRQSLVYDGNPPEEAFEDFDDDFDDGWDQELDGNFEGEDSPEQETSIEP